MPLFSTTPQTRSLHRRGFLVRCGFALTLVASALALALPGAGLGAKANSAPTATVTLQGPPAGPGAPANAWRPRGQLTAKATATDADKNKITLTFIWKVNGVVADTTTGDAKDGHFALDGLDGGDTVTVSVVPNDGSLNGQPALATGSVVNHAPTASVTLNQLKTGGQATATVAASDADNDPISFTYVWSVNGALEQIDTGKHETTDNFKLDGSIDPGDKVAVRVVPTDGFINGSVVTDKENVSSSGNGKGAAPGPSGKGGPAPTPGPGPGPGPAASTTATVTTATATAYNASSDPYSIANTTLFTGAQSWWKAGFDGQGVDVAVIDTGVSPAPGLDNGNKVVNGPDLSIDSQNSKLTYLDSNGHGTFMAGLIAANSSDYKGMAPGARIVNVKVGATDGEVDVTQVIAAIDWVVQHAHDNGLNIRVISLSYGTNSTQPYAVDPLAYAAEQAWKAGIVVITAAGNTGYQTGAGAPGVADPGYDPYLISVGGYSTQGTSDTGDDRLGDYSASSPGCAPAAPAKPGTPALPLCKGPDFVNVGSHVQGLRVAGSYIDQENPDGRLGTLYFRGSGTSEATALTAGAAALILDKYPQLTPDQVKAFLTNGARKIAGIDDTAQGAGEIDLGHLLTAPTGNAKSQSFANSTGTGSIEISRGSDHLSYGSSTLSGEQDIFGHSVDTGALATLEAQGNSWSSGTWNGNSWSGNSWSGNSWSGNSWSGNSWSGNSWSGNSWSGNSWSGNSWSGNSWSGNSWSGNSWSGNSWSGNSWSSADWS